MFFSQHFRRFAGAAILAFLFSAPLFSQGQGLPKAPQAQVFTLTPTPGSFTEPAIAVNPANPQQVVGVFQDNVHAAYSQDAGRTWRPAENVDPKNYKVSGDVSVAFDNLGHAFVCYIAFDKLGTFQLLGAWRDPQRHFCPPLARWRKDLGSRAHSGRRANQFAWNSVRR